MPSDTEDVTSFFDKLYRDVDYRNRRPGRTGRIVDGVLDPNPVNAAPVGYVWVREGEDGERGEAVALIISIRDDITDLPIELGERVPGGELCAIRPLINERSNSLSPGQLPATGVPRTPDALNTGDTQTITNTVGRVRPSVVQPDTLNVYIEPFWYNNQRYGAIDEIDVGAANVPSGLEEMRWAWITFDPVSETYNTRTSVIAIFSHPDYLPIVDSTYGLTSIDIPAGEIPLAPPLILVSGQTGITPANIQYSASRFEDTRHWLNARGTLLSEAPETVTIASGVATLGSGSNFVLAAESGTADTVTSFVVTGVPRLLLFMAGSGDTITTENGSAVDFNSGSDFVQTGNMGLILFWNGTTVIDIGTGGAPARFSQTASVTVANTATETTLVGAGSGSLTLIGGALTVGDVIRVRAQGYHSTKASAAGTLTLRVHFGATEIVATAAVTVTNALSNRGWSLETDITIRSTGATGTVFGQGLVRVFTSNSAASFWEMVETATTTVDFTADPAISVTAQWGTADTDNTITCTGLVIEKLTP